MRRLLIGLALLAVLACAVWYFAIAPRRAEAPAPAPPDTLSTGYKSARLYFASASADTLVGESREMAEPQSLHQQVSALVSELDRGPTGPGVAALPPGTSVLHVYLDDRGLMTLDLSRAFQQGFRGGSSAEYLAVASLVRTLAVNVPEVKRVLIVCGGVPLASLGGHLPLDRPIEVSEIP
jgi:hypothetical protein